MIEMGIDEQPDEREEYAKEVINQLFERRVKRNERFRPEHKLTNDIAQNIGLFLNEIRHSRNSKVPAMKINDDIGYFPMSQKVFDGIHRFSTRRYAKGRLSKRHNENIELIHKDDAEFFFKKNATSFLNQRIKGIQNEQNVSLNFIKSLRGRQNPIGCHFIVRTNSSGLRVFWSGAYFISPNYFGAPTSPVTETLQSGRYIFGVDGKQYGSKIQWDTNAIVSLPGNPSVHLNY